jgi:integrase
VTAAIMMLTSGIDVKTAASRLGHADPALLFSTYSHFIASADRAAADKLESLLGG